MRHISQNFELIDKIGSGTFSSVYKAKRKSDDLIVAIKIIEAQSEDDIKTIVTEGNVLMHLKGRHPSIPKIYDFFNDGPMFFIIMEYLDGFITLLDWLIPFTPLVIDGKYIKDDLHTIKHEDEISSIFYQIVSSVSFLYQNSVVHRDLKLENIMINPKTKMIKIIDFGLSIISESLTWSNICGSLEYMAPEIVQDIVKDQNENFYQKTESSLYTTKSEVWSLGIILYGMTYCKLPFYNSKKIRLMTLICNTNPSYEPKGLIFSQNLKDLIESLLTKDPTKRINFKRIFCHPFLNNNNHDTIRKICHKSYSCKEDIEKLIIDDKHIINSKPNSKAFIEEPFDSIKNNMKSDAKNGTQSTDSLPHLFMSRNSHKKQKPWQNIEPRPIKAKMFAPNLI